MHHYIVSDEPTSLLKLGWVNSYGPAGTGPLSYSSGPSEMGFRFATWNQHSPAPPYQSLGYLVRGPRDRPWDREAEGRISAFF